MKGDSILNVYTDMKPEQQRIAIAEACGWKRYNAEGTDAYLPDDPNDPPFPDYLNDLDACNGLVDWLNERGWSCILIAENSMRCCTFVRHGVEHKIIKSTFPRAICESFLRAVEKWVD